MLYELVSFSDYINALNVFRYITFRTGGAIMTALLFVFLFGPVIIDALRVKQGRGQPIRDDGPQTHLAKRGTPTMGGLMILSGFVVATLLWANLANPYVWVVLGVTLAYGAIGFCDDYMKVTKSTVAGFSGRIRFSLELGIAAIATLVLMYLSMPEMATALTVPFFKDIVIDLGPFFVLLGVVVIAGAGNAVNLTDGLDGLAIVVMIACDVRADRVPGNVNFARYLQIHYVPEPASWRSFAVRSSARAGFLVQRPPAMIMGDTGSLALGGARDHAGNEARVRSGNRRRAVRDRDLSVIIQVVSFADGQRVFRMAPLHHHFEQKGWYDRPW